MIVHDDVDRIHDEGVWRMINLQDLVRYTDDLLDTERFKDYCPNGLQVEGRSSVRKIVSGVTASRDLIEAAIANEADVLLVHHGYFWRGEDPRIVGIKRQRIELLLQHQISLLAYHLPLDAHPIYGNNAQLAEILGFDVAGRFGDGLDTGLGMYGSLCQPLKATDMVKLIETKLQRVPLHIAGDSGMINKVAWCTGAAQSYIEQAVTLGVDAYISGEVSEPTYHIARENGIHYFSAGHHATERYGAMALAQHLADHFGLEHQFVDINNPV